MTRKDEAIEAAADAALNPILSSGRHTLGDSEDLAWDAAQAAIAAYEAHMRPEVTSVDELLNLHPGTVLVDAMGRTIKALNSGIFLTTGVTAGFTEDRVAFPARVIHWGTE